MRSVAWLRRGIPRVVEGSEEPGRRLVGVARAVDSGPTPMAHAVRRRCAEIIAALTGGKTELADTPHAVAALVAALDPLDEARSWLLLSALRGRLPHGDEVVSTVRLARLSGVAAAVQRTLEDLLAAGVRDWPDVSVIVGRHLVDVHHTSSAGFATGIQRVTREATRRWFQRHDPLLIGWYADFGAMRAMSETESRRARLGGPAATSTGDDAVIVPWRCTYILPELAAEVARAGHLQTMAQYSGTTLNMIGYDLVPVTTAETSHEGLVPGFARNLAAARYARVIAPISVGAGGEYEGWRTMLSGAGLPGPRIEPVVLPAEAPAGDPGALATARSRLLVGALPLVLVVGSHEPRKNHSAVLHAAELLWREGHRFSLTFIGGNSWNSERFVATLEDMQSAGRPVEAISAATDDLLWGGYRIARFTVFPSINEGFGLPVAESLACGTPVITSEYGSMREIADAGGGALLVDPRDDHSIAAAMRALITDDALLAKLRSEAMARPVRTWDEYAEDTWRILAAPDGAVGA